jgi:hypothetical protein
MVGLICATACGSLIWNSIDSKLKSLSKYNLIKIIKKLSTSTLRLISNQAFFPRT